MKKYRNKILEQIREQGHKKVEKEKDYSIEALLANKTPEEQVERLITLSEVTKELARQTRLECGEEGEKADNLTAISVVARILAEKIAEEERHRKFCA